MFLWDWMILRLGGTETSIDIYEHNWFLRYLPINNHLLWWFRSLCNWGSGIQKSWISLEGPWVMEPGAEALRHLDQSQVRADSVRTWREISTRTVTFIVWQRVIRWAKAKIRELLALLCQTLGREVEHWISGKKGHKSGSHTGLYLYLSFPSHYASVCFLTDCRPFW